MGQLQYISTSGGSFECVLSANFTIDSVVEHKFSVTSTSTSQYIRFALGDNHINMRLGSSWTDMYFHNGGVQSISSLLTLNEVHTAMLSATKYMFDETTFSANATNLPSGTPTYGISNFYGSIYSSIVRENRVKTIELLPWINDNDVVGLYDAVSQTFYAPSSGTWTAGPPYTPPTPTINSKIYLGSNNLASGKIKLGSSDVSAIYIGSTMVYGGQ